jgi:hypothetical protein
MNSTKAWKHIGFALCTLMLLLAVSPGAFASCGDSLVAMAAATAVHRPFQTTLPSPSSPSGVPSPDNNGVIPSIVGMWHTNFEVNGQTIQEAFQIWNMGGTEVHNPNVDPRTGNVCVGVWTAVGPQTYKLVHRVWWYDSTGDFMGTIHLHETVTLGDRGSTHSGSFTLDFYDPNNNFLMEVAGNVLAERVTGN